MYTHYNGTHNNVCTKLRTTVYGGGRGLRGPVGVRWCACDKTNTVNHVAIAYVYNNLHTQSGMYTHSHTHCTYSICI